MPLLCAPLFVSLLVSMPGVSVAGAGAVAPPPARLSEAQAIAALQAELEKEAGEDQFSGSVLVAKNGIPIFQKAYGYADRAKEVLNTVDTRFRFGSMGKMFTAVAVLQLVEAGKIKLSDPVARFIPDYPNKEVAAVTVEQLLTHTGGTGDIFTPEYFEKRNEIKTLRDYVALYGNRGLEFPPGSKWSYSNYGFVLLGRIIEVVSGQTYSDYVRDHVFERAGMSSTGNTPEVEHVQGLAMGYTRDSGPHLMHVGPGPGAGGASELPNPTLKGPPPGEGADRDAQKTAGPAHSIEGTLPYSGTSAGGGYTTAGDLLKFANALASNKLLTARYSELLVEGKVDTPRPGIRYAYGFEDQTAPDGVRFFGHGGGSPGMNGRLMIFARSGYVVIALANLDPPAADNIARFIGDRLPVQ